MTATAAPGSTPPSSSLVADSSPDQRSGCAHVRRPFSGMAQRRLRPLHRHLLHRPPRIPGLARPSPNPGEKLQRRFRSLGPCVARYARPCHRRRQRNSSSLFPVPSLIGWSNWRRRLEKLERPPTPGPTSPREPRQASPHAGSLNEYAVRWGSGRLRQQVERPGYASDEPHLARLGTISLNHSDRIKETHHDRKAPPPS